MSKIKTKIKIPELAPSHIKALRLLRELNKNEKDLIKKSNVYLWDRLCDCSDDNRKPIYKAVARILRRGVNFQRGCNHEREAG
jgi:hypothetical protein